MVVAGTSHGTVSDIGDPSQTAWRTGESISFTVSDNDIEPDQRVTIRLIHEPSGDSVYTTTVTVPSA